MSTTKSASKKTKAKKITNSPKAPFKFSRHIAAPAVGIFMFSAAFGVLNFQWIQAQALYRFGPPLASTNVVVETKSPDNITTPTIAIPKIRVNAPIVFLADTKNSAIENGLKSGVVHYGGSVSPGQQGNVVIFGHSSGLAWADGDYKFIFTLLDKLTRDDKIIVDSNGTRYIYNVTGSTVVEAEDVSVLGQTRKNVLTLITCTPVGTSSKRLVLTAEQISPTPTLPTTKNTALPVAPHPVTSFDLPGNSQSFWRSLKELF